MVEHRDLEGVLQPRWLYDYTEVLTIMQVLFGISDRFYWIQQFVSPFVLIHFREVCLSSINKKKKKKLKKLQLFKLLLKHNCIKWRNKTMRHMSNTPQCRVSREGTLMVVFNWNFRGNLTQSNSDPYGNFSLGSGNNILNLGRNLRWCLITI